MMERVGVNTRESRVNSADTLIQQADNVVDNSTDNNNDRSVVSGKVPKKIMILIFILKKVFLKEIFFTFGCDLKFFSFLNYQILGGVC